jgi:hypothetical protein
MPFPLALALSLVLSLSSLCSADSTVDAPATRKGRFDQFSVEPPVTSPVGVGRNVFKLRFERGAELFPEFAVLLNGAPAGVAKDPIKGPNTTASTYTWTLSNGSRLDMFHPGANSVSLSLNGTVVGDNQCAVFVTDDCPFRGQYGVGTKDCKSCPPGGLCPGGNRVYPMPGYYSTGPTDDRPVRCGAWDACDNSMFGGDRYTMNNCDPPRDAHTVCKRGYMGLGCNTCETGYIRNSEGSCVAPGAAMTVVRTLFLLAMLAGVAAAFRAAERSTLFGIPFVVQMARLSQGTAFIFLVSGKDSYACSSVAGITVALQYWLPTFSGYLDHFVEAGGPLGRTVLQLMFAAVFAVPLLVTPALAWRRGDHDAVRPLLRRAAAAWVWMLSLPLLVISTNAFLCDTEGQVLHTPSARCHSGEHIAAIVADVVLLPLVLYAHWKLAHNVGKVSRSVDGPDSASDSDYISYAFIYGHCVPGKVGWWKIDVVPTSIVLILHNFPQALASDLDGKVSRAIPMVICTLSSVILAGMIALVLHRRPFVGLATFSHALGYASLVFSIWTAVAKNCGWGGGNASSIIGSVLSWVGFLLLLASFGTGFITLWRSRKRKSVIRYPAGYGSLDDGGDVPQLVELRDVQENLADGEDIY